MKGAKSPFGDWATAVRLIGHKPRPTGIPRCRCFVYHTSMATKTVTLTFDAYELLRRAKRTPGESFSSVVRRAQFPEDSISGAEALECAPASPLNVPPVAAPIGVAEILDIVREGREREAACR